MKEEHLHIELFESIGVKRNQIIYIEPAGQKFLSDEDYNQLKIEFKNHRFDLISLSYIFSNIPETLLSFYTPEYKTKDVDVNETISFIESTCNIKISTPTCLRFDNIRPSDVKYVMMGEEENAVAFLKGYLSLIDPDIKRYKAERTGTFSYGDIIHYFIVDKSLDDEIAKSFNEEQSDNSICEAQPNDEIATAETLIKELQNMREEDLRKLGLSIASLRFLLKLKAMPSPSRMRITRHAKIILEDFNNREIKLDDKTKALYFLYLRHPEGIAIKSLPDHIEELLDLYQSFSGRDDKTAMRKTIENLADPFQNNANISLSRIKKAFCEAFDMQIAKYYFVDGERGESRKVSLDRKLITWETIR